MLGVIWTQGCWRKASVTDTRTSTDLLLMRVGCCRTLSSSRPSLSSSRLRATSASWHMSLNVSSRFRNMENSLCRCLVVTRIASVIRLVETRSSRVTPPQGITNLTGGRERRIKLLNCWGSHTLCTSSVFLIQTAFQRLYFKMIFAHGTMIHIIATTQPHSHQQLKTTSTGNMNKGVSHLPFPAGRSRKPCGWCWGRGSPAEAPGPSSSSRSSTSPVSQMTGD